MTTATDTDIVARKRKSAKCYCLEDAEGNLMPAYCGLRVHDVREFAATGLGFGEWPSIARHGYKVRKVKVSRRRK